MDQGFPTLVYSLCFLTSSACALLLFRNYRQTRARLLLWSALCFGFIGLNNLAVIVDLLLIPDIDFSLLRVVLSLSGVTLLLYGLVWDVEGHR